MIEYEGIVKKIRCLDQDSNYSIVSLEADNTLIRIGGYFPGVYKGSYLSVRGEYKPDRNGGFKLEPFWWRTELPTRKYDMINFLKSLVIDEYTNRIRETSYPLDESTADNEIEYVLSKIVDEYHDKTYSIIQEGVEQISCIHPDLDRDGKFSKIPLLLIEELEWIQYYACFTSEIVGINAQLAQYAIKMINVISERREQLENPNPFWYLRNDPYVFCEYLEDDGFEFPDADMIAMHYNLPMDSFSRCKAGIRYGYKKHVLSEGDVYASQEQLMKAATDVLKLDEAILIQNIDRMIIDGFLVKDRFDEECIYLWEYHLMECSIAEKLSEMNRRNRGNTEIIPDFDAVNRSLNIELDEQQKDAITTAINSPITIITGGPGTGKTTIIRGLVAALSAEGITNISLAAPTGKASLRIKKSTGLHAQTIHRLLKITPKSHREEAREITEDVIIIDEFSMVDVALMDKLVYALGLHVKLVFVGDADQLPSVGPGNILHDLIESGQFSVARLTQVHRQAENSSIVRNSHRVINGEMIDLNYTGETDLVFEQAKDKVEIEDLICRIVERILKEDPNGIKNIQVLSPVKEGLAGTKSLNSKLQALLNHEVNSFETIDHKCIKSNDRVMVTQNDYTVEVFNGEISDSSIVGYDEQTYSNYLRLIFDESRIVTYQEHERKTKWLELAYAITVHKSQGSEYEHVIMPVFNSKALHRNLIYTAMTRAKGRLYLVGTREDLKKGIENVEPVKRNTKLKERIQQQHH